MSLKQRSKLRCQQINELFVGQDIYSYDRDFKDIEWAIVMVSKYFIRIQNKHESVVIEIDKEDINPDRSKLSAWYTDKNLMDKHKVKYYNLK